MHTQPLSTHLFFSNYSIKNFWICHRSHLCSLGRLSSPIGLGGKLVFPGLSRNVLVAPNLFHLTEATGDCRQSCLRGTGPRLHAWFELYYSFRQAWTFLDHVQPAELTTGGLQHLDDQEKQDAPELHGWTFKNHCQLFSWTHKIIVEALKNGIQVKSHN